MDRWGVFARYRELVLSAGLAVLFVVEIALTSTVPQHRAAAAAVGAAMALSLLARRVVPLVPLVCAVVLIALGHTLVVGVGDTATFFVVLLMAIFAGGSYGSTKERVLAGLVTTALIPLAAMDPRDPPALTDWIYFVLFIDTTFVGGAFFRRRRDRDSEMAGRATRAEAESLSRARDAVLVERGRIARELHDVVSHSIGVMVVQARAGRKVLGGTEPAVTEALDAIEGAGESALAEMRRFLTLLRFDDEAAALDPAPGVGRIADLLSGMANSGLALELVSEGQPIDLPPGVDLSAYRIVQEALTNVIKHAGAARAVVTVRYRPDALVLEVRDDGAGTGPGGGSGFGLEGIRERVALYGGELSAAPCEGGGFRVRARLPIGAAP